MDEMDDRWGNLWNIAVAEIGVYIIPTGDMDIIDIEWPSGKRNRYRWIRGRWILVGMLLGGVMLPVSGEAFR